MLDVLNLHNGLDDAVNALAGLGKVALHAENALDVGNLLLGELALGDAAGQVLVGPLLHVLQDGGGHVVHGRAVAIDGGVQGDLTAHAAAAHHTNVLDLHMQLLPFFKTAGTMFRSFVF